MHQTKLAKDVQFFIRYKNKPITPAENDITYVKFDGVWIRSYKNNSMLGRPFISEASWETNWFNRNLEILDMILTNNKNTAKKLIGHSLPEIAFLAKEIINNNYISIFYDKIFEIK